MQNDFLDFVHGAHVLLPCPTNITHINMHGWQGNLVQMVCAQDVNGRDCEQMYYEINQGQVSVNWTSEEGGEVDGAENPPPPAEEPQQSSDINDVLQ